HYYTASRGNPSGPVLGVIDAQREFLSQLVPALNVAAVQGVHPSGSTHSVAVDPENNRVFVPLPANNVFPNCLTGCVAVVGTSRATGTAGSSGKEPPGGRRSRSSSTSKPCSPTSTRTFRGSPAS